MLTVESAFKKGLKLVREAGLPAKGNDVPVLAAYNVFVRHCQGKETDERFDYQAPLHAKQLILTAFAHS